jgi:rare lipoprotein A
MMMKMPMGSQERALLVRWICLWGACLLLAAGCTTERVPPATSGVQRPYRVGGRWYRPLDHAEGFHQRGLASWYGKDFDGRKTASGEIYDMNAMTAAHKILPLGTWVRVTNLENGKSATVRINDRGPFVHGRIIDLSYRAATALGVVGPGTSRVEIQALGRLQREPDGKRSYIPLAYDRGIFTIQVGAFRNRQNAERLVRRLDQRYRHAHMIPFDTGQGVFYRVRVGRCASLEEARNCEERLARDGYAQATIVAE